MLTHSCLGVFIQSPCSGQLWRRNRMRRRRRRRCGRMKHKKYSYEDPASFEHSPLCLFDLEGTFTPRCCCSTGGFLTLLQSTALIMDSYHTAVLRQQSALYCTYVVVGGGEGGIEAWPVKKERAETKHLGFRWVERGLLQFRQFQDRCCGWQRYRTTCDKPQLRSVTSAGTLASPGAMLWRHHITWWVGGVCACDSRLWRHHITWWIGGVELL